MCMLCFFRLSCVIFLMVQNLKSNFPDQGSGSLPFWLLYSEGNRWRKDKQMKLSKQLSKSPHQADVNLSTRNQRVWLHRTSEILKRHRRASGQREHSLNMTTCLTRLYVSLCGGFCCLLSMLMVHLTVSNLKRMQIQYIGKSITVKTQTLAAIQLIV